MQIADALAQTRWALGFEYALYEKFSSAVRRERTRPLAYCVGHGCFIRRETLLAIGLLPTQSPNDDLALGYLASALGLEICPALQMDYCEGAGDPISAIKQSRFWYRGSARFYQDIRYYEEKFAARLSRRQRFRLWVDGHARNLAWAWRGVLFLASLLWALATGTGWLIAAVVASHVLYVHWGLLVTWMALRQLARNAPVEVRPMTARTLALAAMTATAVFIIRSLGPLGESVSAVLNRTATTVYTWRT
jgi:hypothetical protein